MIPYYILWGDDVCRVTDNRIININTDRVIWEDSFINIKTLSFNTVSEKSIVLFPCKAIVSPDFWFNVYTGVTYAHKYVDYIGKDEDSLYYKTASYVYRVSMWNNNVLERWVCKPIRINIRWNPSITRIGDFLFINLSDSSVILHKENPPIRNKCRYLYSYRDDLVLIGECGLTSICSLYKLGDTYFNSPLYSFKAGDSSVFPLQGTFLDSAYNRITYKDIYGNILDRVIDDAICTTFYKLEDGKFVRLKMEVCDG